MTAPEPFVTCASCGERMRWEQQLDHVCKRDRCYHESADGISPLDMPDAAKVWRCTGCGWLHLSMRQQDGSHQQVDVEEAIASYQVSVFALIEQLRADDDDLADRSMTALFAEIGPEYPEISISLATVEGLRPRP